jgi:hypothetical protein
MLVILSAVTFVVAGRPACLCAATRCRNARSWREACIRVRAAVTLFLATLRCSGAVVFGFGNPGAAADPVGCPGAAVAYPDRHVEDP